MTTKAKVFGAMALCAAVLIAGCSRAAAPMSAEDNSTGSPQNPPLPRTESILPLEKGNTWLYTYTVYDSAGDTLWSRYDLTLSIADIFGLQQSSTVALNRNNWDDFDHYAYTYEWNRLDEGDLVTFFDRDEAAVPGVYHVGWYDKKVHHLYATPRLWLAYPASKGYTWQVADIDSSGDTLGTRDMEVVSTNEKFYFPETRISDASALAFVDCYLYKESYQDTVAYYYYNEDLGAVGYLQYGNGKVAKSYILNEFRQEYYYYY